ncbi:MAG: hypothetical protein RLY78_3232 [Pseudomonadota bacterium]
MTSRPWARAAGLARALAGGLVPVLGTAALAQPAAAGADGALGTEVTLWGPWLGAALGIVGAGWALLAQLRLQGLRRAHARVEAEREAAAVQARRLSRQLDATLAALPDLLFEFDLAGRYVAVHVGQDSALLAAAPQHIIGRRVDDLLPPAAAAIVHESLAAAQLHGRDQGRRIQLTLPDGQARWFELASGRKTAAGQDDDEHVLMLSRDITALVEAEQQLALLRHELQDCHQAARFQPLFEQAPAALAVLRDGGIVDANPAFRALAGPVTPGMPIADWCQRGLSDAQVLGSLAHSWLWTGGQGPDGALLPVLHLPWRDGDGRRRLLQLHGRRSATGCVLGLCDLSLEAQDAELARAETRAMNLQLQWLATSWRAPLQRLGTALGPLAGQGAAAESWQLLQDLQLLLDAVTEPPSPPAHDAAPGGARSPAPSGGNGHDEAPAPLGLLAAEALQRLARAGRARHRELVLQVDPAVDDWRVATPTLWRALLLGLGHAVLQASADAGALVVTLGPSPDAPPGGSPREARSGSTGPGGPAREGDAALGGPGAPCGSGGSAEGPAEGRLRLELTLQSAATRPGTAAGRPSSTPPAALRATACLAESLARALCERLGGRWMRQEITAADGPADDAPWQLDLPCRRHTGPERRPPAQATGDGDGLAAAPPRTALAALTGLRALVIDDLPPARQALQQRLQAAGLTVTAVDDAAHALARLVTEQAGEQAPALICIDAQMPDMDGTALGLAIRALQLPGPPLLALFSPPTAGGPLPEGFDARLDKPLQPRQLDHLLQRLLAVRSPPEAGPGESREERSPDRPPELPVGPVACAAAAPDEAAGIAPVPAAAPAPSRRPHVLVVDDNALNREVAADALRHAGIEVSTAEDGLMALEWLEHHTPDLVLMDVQMPRLDGVRATEVLRQMPALHRVPVIALTANGAEEDRQRCLAAGMDDHLCKPVLPTSLVLQVGHWLQHGRRAPVAPPPPAEAVLIDLQRGLMLCGGGQALYRAMLNHFVDHQPAARARLQQAWAAADSRLVGHLVHTLKGSAAQIGALRLQQACETVEAGWTTASALACGHGAAAGAGGAGGADPGDPAEGADGADGAADHLTAADAQTLLRIWDASVAAARQHLSADPRQGADPRAGRP